MNIRKLNSITKYPSIPTFHDMGDRGRLLPTHIDLSGKIWATEKIDGTNARIIMHRNLCLIGERENFLTCLGDVIYNPSQGIVDTVLSVANRVYEQYLKENEYYLKEKQDNVVVVFGEVFGNRETPRHKQYGSGKTPGFRVFDVAYVDLDDLLDLSVENISSWRQHGGQSFLNVDELSKFCNKYGLCKVPDVSIDNIPLSLEDTLKCLESAIPKSLSVIDDKGIGNPEGIVVRTFDRSKIAKIRFEDYRKTLCSQKTTP